MSAVAEASLSELLVEKCGLARIIAVGVVRRACNRAGTSPEALTRHDLARVVEAMEPLIMVYLPPAEVNARMAELRRIAR